MKTSILSVLFFSALSLAHPAKVPKRNVLIPGPGMPSVESLGLTQEDLDRIPEEWGKLSKDSSSLFYILARTYNLKLEISHHLNNTLEARQDFSCWQSLACNLNDAIQGYNFLAALQHYNCAVGSIGAQFAQVGNCQWWGFPNGGVQSASSWWYVPSLLPKSFHLS